MTDQHPEAGSDRAQASGPVIFPALVVIIVVGVLVFDELQTGMSTSPMNTILAMVITALVLYGGYFAGRWVMDRV